MTARAPVLVVGAGVAGLSAAVWLARRGHPVTVRESAAAPGGLLEAISFEGAEYDRGSHRIHGDAREYLRAQLPSVDWVERPRRGVLVLAGRHAGYPLQPWSFAQALGATTTLRMTVGWALRPRRWGRFRSWERDRRDAEHDEGYERFVLSRVGSAAYESFYRPYVEKVWGIDPSQLSASVARQRFSSSSPVARVLRARGRESFWYPKSGMAGFIHGLMDTARALGVTVETGREVDEAELRSWPGVLHTGPLESVAGTGGLARRGLYLLHIKVTGEPIGNADTWYVPGAESWFGRVSRPAAFTGAPEDGRSTVLAVEIPEGRWGEGRDFTSESAVVLQQLIAAGILPMGTSLLAVKQSFVRGVYPEYRRGWVTAWGAAMAAVAGRGNVFMAGRQGLFLHCNIDHALSSALAAAEQLSAGRPVSGWAAAAVPWLDMKVRD